MVWHRRHPAPGNNISLHGEIKLQKTKHYSPRHGEPQMQEWPVHVLSNNMSSHETAFCKYKETKGNGLIQHLSLELENTPNPSSNSQRDSETRSSQTSPCLTCSPNPAGQRWWWSVFNLMFCIELDHTKLHQLSQEGQTRGRLHLEHSWSQVQTISWETGGSQHM